jgi:hypothetical protein
MTVAGFRPMMMASDWQGKPSQTNGRSLQSGPIISLSSSLTFFLHVGSPRLIPEAPMAAMAIHLKR